MTHVPLDPAAEAGFGIAGWALVTMLMSTLRTQGTLSHEIGASIIDHALHLIEGMDETFRNEAFRQARAQLENATKTWHDTLPAPQSPRAP